MSDKGKCPKCGQDFETHDYEQLAVCVANEVYDLRRQLAAKEKELEAARGENAAMAQAVTTAWEALCGERVEGGRAEAYKALQPVATANHPGQSLLDELARLREIVGKLPKTADGVPIVPTMRIYARAEHDIRVNDDEGDGIVSADVAIIREWPEGQPEVYGRATNSSGWRIYPSCWYSTREAAAAAKESK